MHRNSVGDKTSVETGAGPDGQADSQSRDVVNLADRLRRVQHPWSPGVVAELNDYQVKLAKFIGEFVWHRHEDTDELFLVLQGEMGIEMRDRPDDPTDARTVHLREGELFVVARQVEHRPFAKKECHVLLIEPRGVVNTGDADSALRADNDIWL